MSTGIDKRLGLGLPLAGLLVVALAGQAGCGPDARWIFAETTVRLSNEAITSAEASGGEIASLEAPLDEVMLRLDQTQRALDVWRDHAGPLAYRTRAPCLRAALLSLREALVAEGEPVPPTLDEAEAMLEEVGGRCGRPRPPPSR